MTVRFYAAKLKTFYDYLPPDKQIVLNTLETWRQALLAEGYAPATVNTNISAANGLLDYLGRRDLQLMTIVHTEGLGNIHQSHSFVRGNWGNTAKSNFMLLAKSCHDIDLLQWLMKKKCTKIQSFGSLKYFRRENAPADAPERCIDGCPHAETCPYNAVRLYLDDKNTAISCSMEDSSFS